MKLEKKEKKYLIKKSENISEWYTDVILKSGLADYVSVKGCMIFKPYGYGLWENIQKIFDAEIKKAGVQNVYFPLFIPEKLLKKEKSHVKGFSPELAVVTIGGGKKLKERLVVRPTSETIMYEAFAKWIKSWRDLPLLINQWCNVVRWELRTYLFLRTTEFLWQEGHTVHATHEESVKEVKRALKGYVDLYENYFGIAGIYGKKSEAEKFPGAKETYTFEMLMPDGKALQGCTSHDLGQNFAKAFNISFLDKEGKRTLPWQTSWGFSTRSIGALILSHGDDHGLVMPPRLAPIQIVIVPVFQNSREDDIIEKNLQEIKNSLQEFRVVADARREYSVGWKFNEWELKGVPLRLELGQREIQEDRATLVRRDNGQKISVPLANLEKEIKIILETIQKNLFEKSKNFLQKNTREVTDYKEFKNIMKTTKGFIRAFWCGDEKCEKRIKEDTKATIRCLPLDSKEENGNCIYCKKPAKEKWIFGQAY